MALVSRIQIDMGHEKVVAHPDFDKEWCRKLLADKDIQWKRQPRTGVTPEKVTNSMFEWTLYGERGIRAHLSFRRPCKEPDSIKPTEDCFLLSIGDGLDGKTGRAHGGLTSVIMDHICGHAAHDVSPSPVSPATATMTVDYKRPVDTPLLILARAWIISYEGRKVWVRAVIEDDKRRVYSTGKCLFILGKSEKL